MPFVPSRPPDSVDAELAQWLHNEFGRIETDTDFARTLEIGNLTDGATVAWNLFEYKFATLTLGGNRTLANPNRMENGKRYVLIVKQDATGGRTLSFGSAYLWPGGTAPTISVGANAVDVLTFVSDGTSMFGVAQQNYS